MTMQQSHLDYILRMTVKTLCNLEIEQALDATANDGSAFLRARIKKLARQKIGEGEPLLKLQALLQRCKRATEKRNDYVHSVWGRELDGALVMRSEDHTWDDIPTVNELMSLVTELQRLRNELNAARVDGFLSEALNSSR